MSLRREEPLLTSRRLYVGTKHLGPKGREGVNESLTWTVSGDDDTRSPFGENENFM